mmetsp:Transcript_49886/g.121073  ORF Transcript_49886/g.121073 Transcript_49886/m.121073 type:complete len:225 (-) Transcript_49886:3-677(-)
MCAAISIGVCSTTSSGIPVMPSGLAWCMSTTTPKLACPRTVLTGIATSSRATAAAADAFRQNPLRRGLHALRELRAVACMAANAPRARVVGPQCMHSFAFAPRSRCQFGHDQAVSSQPAHNTWFVPQGWGPFGPFDVKLRTVSFQRRKVSAAIDSGPTGELRVSRANAGQNKRSADRRQSTDCRDVHSSRPGLDVASLSAVKLQDLVQRSVADPASPGPDPGAL